MSGRPASKPTTLAVIPAAGKGSRLGLDLPKVLAPIRGATRVWDILYQTLAGLVDHIHVVLSPAGYSHLRPELDEARLGTPASCSIQPVPVGMGDAVFRGLDCCPGFDHVLVVWGDQAGVTRETIGKVVDAQSRFQGGGFSLPLVAVENPYVQYDLAPDGSLANVRESREGDVCDPAGLSDVGVFAFTCRGLIDCWKAFRRAGPAGARTGEINLLPLLPYLSSRCGWPVTIIPVRDPREARGLNTGADLEHFRACFHARRDS
jgi:bifunctional UDP-N-acetylglucosamine pyrophosphorylase/glucosamine-1-phosphate N-acetyltransferase